MLKIKRSFQVPDETRLKIGAALDIHRPLGPIDRIIPYILESTYNAALDALNDGQEQDYIIFMLMIELYNELEITFLMSGNNEVRIGDKNFLYFYSVASIILASHCDDELFEGQF